MSYRSPDLGDFTAALRDRLQEQLDDDRPSPDVADAVDRAVLLDARAVPAGLRESLPAGGEPEEVLALDLVPFTEALRDKAEDAARQRITAAIPLAPASRASVVRRWVVGGLLTAAAAAVAWNTSASWTTAPQRVENSPTWMGAEQSLPGRSDDLELLERGEPADSRPNRVPLEPERLLEPPVEEAQEEEEPPLPEAPTAPPANKRRAPTVDELEARAQEHWRAGRLDQAADMLRGIIARGSPTQADLAFGDLFAVERQRGGASAEARVWRAYLKRFPSGRFAEDARAGLCGRAASDEREQCWRRYLEAHPQGAYAARARTELEVEG